MRHEESRHGQLLMQWAATVRLDSGHRLSDVLVHCPNGGQRNAREGARLRLEGVKPGQPDYHLPIAVAPWHSLYIELKKPGAAPSEVSQAQRERAILLESFGNKVVFARGWAMAAALIADYLYLPNAPAVSAADVQWLGRVWALIARVH